MTLTLQLFVVFVVAVTFGIAVGLFANWVSLINERRRNKR